MNVWLIVGSAFAQDFVCETEAASDPPIVPMWTSAADGVTELVMEVDPALAVELQLEASFAELAHAWTQGPYNADVTGHLAIRVAPPEGAFLDAAALDYVTVLRAFVLARREGRTEIARRAPPAFLAWPNGQDQPAVVWDRTTAESNAPNGVLSETVRTAFGDLPPNVWVQPSRHNTNPNRE